MKKMVNGQYVDMTQEEIEELNAIQEEQTQTVDEQSALKTFAAALADSDTNSIAKIRTAAQKFLQDTDSAGGE